MTYNKEERSNYYYRVTKPAKEMEKVAYLKLLEADGLKLSEAQVKYCNRHYKIND